VKWKVPTNAWRRGGREGGREEGREGGVVRNRDWFVKWKVPTKA